MAIANELSSDVAAAVLAHDEAGIAGKTENLVEIVRDFHSTLRHLTIEARRSRVHQIQMGTQSASPLNRAVSGNS
jgi:hypothetical protein